MIAKVKILIEGYTNADIKAEGGEEPEFLGVCKKCRRPFKKQEDRCECRPYLCYHCCECGMDCDLCNCKHKR